jgi:hypothetical protein
VASLIAGVGLAVHSFFRISGEPAAVRSIVASSVLMFTIATALIWSGLSLHAASGRKRAAERLREALARLLRSNVAPEATAARRSPRSRRPSRAPVERCEEPPPADDPSAGLTIVDAAPQGLHAPSATWDRRSDADWRGRNP